MKMIEINGQLKPFSLRAGTTCLIPSTLIYAKIFPTHLEFYSLDEGQNIAEVDLPLIGPVEDFNITSEIEKGLLSVSGRSEKGHFKYYLSCEEGDLVVRVKRSCDNFPEGIFWNKSIDLKYTFLLSQNNTKLSFGSHKKQLVSQLCENSDLSALVPILFSIAKGYPQIKNESIPEKGPFELLHLWQKAIEEREPQIITRAIRNLLRVAFTGLLIPQLEDSLHLGILNSQCDKETVPSQLMAYIPQLILSTFALCDGSTLELLPLSLKDFSAGKITSYPVGTFAVASLEWTKRGVNRLQIKATGSGELQIKFPSGVKKCRFQIKGEPAVSFQSSEKISLSEGKEYFFDNFKK